MNLLNCHQTNELLSAFLENELDATTSLKVANHIEKCLACEKELKAFTDISSLVKSSIAQMDKQDLSLNSRASTINDRVKSQIALMIKTEASNKKLALSDSSNKFLEPATNNVVTLNSNRKWVGWGKKLLLSLAASLAIMFFSLFAIGYYATATGPLLSGTARNHRFCGSIELANLDWHKGHSKEQLLEANNINLPQLDNVEAKFSNIHPCEVYKTPFLHIMYSKGDKQISLYYNSQNAVSKLQENIKNVVPNQLYLQQESNLQIGAISSPKKDLWLVAGELTKEEITAIASKLALNTSSKETEQSKIFH